MKKFLFLGALAAMLLGTASCSNEMEPEMTGEGTVTIRVELPGNIDSRAIADGLTANKLTVAVYDEDGNELPDIRVNKDIPHQTTVEFQLVKGQTYSFAFWAQAQGAPYTFDTANKTVTVNYENAKSNDEKRDAFYAYKTLTVTGPMTETIYLYRPFAQLNYGASDYAAAVKAGVNVTKSAVTVKKAATAFNLASGEASGEAEVTFTKEVLPNDPATLTVEDKQYQWMAMNYFLVPNNEANIETSLQLYEGDATTAVRDITVPNVPVQKNHRTNIVGNLFTEDVNFNVIIDERFDQPDNNIFYPYLTDAAAIAEAIKTPGAVVNVAPGMELELDLSTIAEGVTINGNSSVLHFTTASTTAAHTLSSENVKFNDLKIINDDTEAAIYVRASNASFNNVELVKTSSQNGFEAYAGNGTEGTISFNKCNLVTKGGYTIRLNGGCVSKMVITDSKVEGMYTFNGNGNNGDIEVSNSTLNGWTSYNNGQGHTVTFTNCKFGIDPERHLSILCPHQETTVTDCIFEWQGESQWNPCEHTTLMPRNASTTNFVNCKWSTGEPLDEQVLATDEDNSYKDCIAIIDGVTWKNLDGNANGNSWTLQ